MVKLSSNESKLIEKKIELLKAMKACLKMNY